ncbi:MAG: DJ-1/PfpI family protein [Candidatus Zixiibacteriota bacterium]
MKQVLSIMAAAILLGLLFTGCKEKQEGIEVVQEESAAEAKSLTGKRVVMIIAPQDFRDEELIEPQGVLYDRGVEVKVASASLEIAKGMLGAQVKPDLLVSDIKVEDWDAIILVGGGGSSVYWDDPFVHSMLNEAVKQNKIVGAICIAPVTLANAGILVGKKATVYSSETQKLVDKGAECTGKEVQIDGNIITASGPPAAKGFGEAIAEALSE